VGQAGRPRLLALDASAHLVSAPEGARLTSWRPDEKVDYDAIAKYHEMRNATLKFVADTRPLEKSDATKAIERYSEALARARECEHFAADRRLFPLIEPGCNGNEVGILDRPTLCLIRSNRRSDAVAAADAYFAALKWTAVRAAY